MAKQPKGSCATALGGTVKKTTKTMISLSEALDLADLDIDEFMEVYYNEIAELLETNSVEITIGEKTYILTLSTQEKTQ
jgi:hypothetical protein